MIQRATTAPQIRIVASAARALWLKTTPITTITATRVSETSSVRIAGRLSLLSTFTPSVPQNVARCGFLRSARLELLLHDPDPRAQIPHELPQHLRVLVHQRLQ